MHGKYRSLRNKVVASLRQSKCSFYMNLKPKSSKTFWKTVNTLSRSKSAIPTLVHNNVAVASDRGKAEALNAHFTKCFSYSVPPIICGSWHYSTSDEISDLLCSEEEVEFLLSSVDPNKATGPDGISARMLKSTAASIAPAVMAIFNLSLIQGQLPMEWKVAQVIPIPKSEQLSNPTNYRPISLLSILSKLLERYVQTHLLNHFHFSKGKSTTGALLSATHAWHMALEAGEDVCCVFWT